MLALPVTLDIHLPASHLVDVLLVQWYTRTPAIGARIRGPDLTRREDELNQLATWLEREYECPEADRPLFVLFPELSLPRTLTDRVTEILEGRGQPTVVIGGLEYMVRDELEELATGLNLTVPPADLTENLHGGEVVNAASVWVSEPGNPVRHFLQPKNHPYEDESPQLCCGELLGFFTSRQQGLGRRLNFTIHVCSDFASAARVRQIREACEQAQTGSHLDFAFVVQHNPNQNAIQFREATRAYFAGPEGATPLAETSGAAVVMINNAAERLQRRGDWADSQFKYQFRHRVRRERLGAPDTYLIRDDGDFDTQSAVMRGTGPGAYLVRYKPRVLVSLSPGQDRPEPFFEGPCLHAEIEGTELEFRPLSAVPHWLRCEWLEERAAFSGELAGRDDCPPEMVEWFEDQLDEAFDLWLATLLARPTSATPLVQNCLLRSDQPGCPPREAEPEQWVDETAAAMHDFLRVFMLSRVGESTDGTRVEPAPEGVRHAVGPLGERVSYVWGRESRTVDVIRRFIEALEQDPFVRSSPAGIVVILMGGPRDAPDPDLLLREFESYPSITKATPPGTVDRGGDVVGAARPLPRIGRSESLEGVLAADSVTEAQDLCQSFWGA